MTIICLKNMLRPKSFVTIFGGHLDRHFSVPDTSGCAPWPGNLKISPSWKFLKILEVSHTGIPKWALFAIQRTLTELPFRLFSGSVRKCPIFSSPERTQRTHPNEKICPYDIHTHIR